MKRFYKVSDQYDGDKFFTIKDGVKYATPLLVVVTVIEFSDVLFAVDSIPAIFAISEDPFILYTSNIFVDYKDNIKFHIPVRPVTFLKNRRHGGTLAGEDG